MPIVLASASPRRHELLRNAGIDFVVFPANIEETRRARECPKEFAERLAREKAQSVRQTISGGRVSLDLSTSSVQALKVAKEPALSLSKGGSANILAADTVVVVDDEVLGKPSNQEDAARMLRMLSGRMHSVITGVCLLGNGFEDVRSEATAVHFSKLTDSEIDNYIQSGEPMDKAGAYAIQGMVSRWIWKIEGDYFNVVGLPVDLVWRMLREHDVP